ncbi:MAG TPA: S9 family peptidase [Patescibacteria group bacterium]|nr:S9 family peptidase [Patescibacteria group bacterium]
MTEQVTTAPRIPLRDFFRNPEKSGFQISPDGKHISFTQPYENRMNVFVQNRETGETVQVTFEKDRDIAGYFWGSNNRILFIRDFGGDENFLLYAVDHTGENLDCLTPFENVRVGIVDELEEIDNEILISINQRNPEVFDVCRINIKTGAMEIVAENPGNVAGWLTDHEGKIRIAITSDGVNQSILYRRTEQDDFKTILTTNFRESVSPLFFDFKNENIYAASNIGRDKSAIIEFDIENGKETGVLFEHPEVDVDNLSFSKKRKVLTAISYTTWKRERKFLDAQTEELFKRLAQKLGKYEIGIADMDKAEEIFIVRTWSDRSLGAYYIYDFKADVLKKLADLSPWLNEDDLCEMKPIQYQSRDGLTIHGYLTLPKGVEPKGLPVVVNPHGGPWVRDTWTYNPEVQFLANRGFAVLQVNYRGSTGYGRKFWEASFKQWGKAMQDDVTDGVNWLIEQGIADPKRVGIYGGSYGGYCTLAGLAFTPDLYACGVDFVGVSNLFTFMKTIPPYWKPFLEMMYEMVGNPEKDIELLRSASPVFHVDKIKAPLFIAQGAKDPRVNVDESDQMVKALRERGVEVPYLVKENEGHGFRNEENKFEFYEAMEEFLEKHLLKK